MTKPRWVLLLWLLAPLLFVTTARAQSAEGRAAPAPTPSTATAAVQTFTAGRLSVVLPGTFKSETGTVKMTWGDTASTQATVTLPEGRFSARMLSPIAGVLPQTAEVDLANVQIAAVRRSAHRLVPSHR